MVAALAAGVALVAAGDPKGAVLAGAALFGAVVLLRRRRARRRAGHEHAASAGDDLAVDPVGADQVPRRGDGPERGARPLGR